MENREKTVLKKDGLSIIKRKRDDAVPSESVVNVNEAETFLRYLLQFTIVKPD